MSKAVLGIDVAKLKLDVALMFDGKTLPRKFDNSPSGHKLLHGWLMSLRFEEVHVCLEATGTYGEAIAEFLYEKGFRVSVVNPLRIKSYALVDLKRNKTDTADARTIADFCLVKNPDDWHPLPPQIKHLQSLTRRVEALEQMLGSERNRLGTCGKEIRPSVKRIIRTLEKEIEQLTRLIQAHIDNHPDLKQQSKLLQTIPGIAKKTAQTLLSEAEFSQFASARALAAHAGLTPRKDQSGTSVNRTRLSKLGNARLRKALYFPAITAMRYNQIIITFSSQLSKKGKTPMQIICAAMRKLLHIAFGVIKHNQPFNQNLASYT